MAPEQPKAEQEHSPIEFASYEDFDKIAKAHTESAELLQWMQDNDVSFDSGLVKVDINGDHVFMDTSKSDFGTIEMNKETNDTKHRW